MPYGHYARAAREHIIELFRSLSREEYEQLANLLENMDEAGWHSWRKENLKETFAYLRASPSERKKKKKWQHPQTTVLLKYSAYREANKAYTLLYAIGVNYLPASGPYRAMTAEAAGAYYLTLVEHFPKWPFDTQPPSWMDDPFGHVGDDHLDY